MRIAFVSFYSGCVNRGAETFVHELASSFASDHSVVVYGNGKRPRTNYEAKAVGLRINRERKDARGTLARKLFIDYWSLLVLRFSLLVAPQVIKKRYDVVILIDGGWESVILRLTTWLYGGKVIISGQSGVGWDDRINLLSFPNTFVGLSEKAAKWAKKVNPFVNSVYIPNGVDMNKFVPKGERIYFGLPHPIFLVVGALEKGKRIDLSIKAVSKLAGASLVVVGKGELENELCELGKSLMGNRFKLMSTNYSEMPKIYRACDVFTLVSTSDYSFEMAILEAMATNLPVVVNSDPIRGSIVGGAGILVNPIDLESYSRALIKALGAKWGTRPRRQAENFSWQKISEKYEEMFANITK